jgi:hypothetical protein
MRPRFLSALLAVLLGSGGSLPTYAQASDPEVERGVRQAQEGESEQAIVTLQGALPRLVERKAPARDIARVHVYLGVAHLGLNDPAAAKTSFLEAIRVDPALRLGSEEYPPRVVRAFEEARRSAPPAPVAATAAPPTTAAAPTAPSGTAPATPSAPQPSKVEPAAKKKGGSKLPLVLLGVGAVGGGVALAAGGGGGGSSTPSSPTTPIVTPPPAPAGSVNLSYSSPPLGGLVPFSAKPGGVSTLPEIKVDVVYGADVPDPWFEINLWRGPDLCFSTSKAYSERVDSSDYPYRAGTTARYYVWVWIVRQPGCGDFFTTDRFEFFWGRPSAALFVQSLPLGWNFSR